MNGGQRQLLAPPLIARFAVTSGSAPLVEAAGRAARSRPKSTTARMIRNITVFAASPWFPTGDNHPFLLQFQFWPHETTIARWYVRIIGRPGPSKAAP
jgi:hypothetical protein